MKILYPHRTASKKGQADPIEAMIEAMVGEVGWVPCLKAALKQSWLGHAHKVVGLVQVLRTPCRP